MHLCLISAAITLMVPKKQYGRANGMMPLVESGPGVFAPLLAGALLPLIRLTGIMLVDVVTFVLTIGTLLAVRVPQPPVTEEGRQGHGNLLREAAYGFPYIFERPSLLGLQLVFLRDSATSEKGRCGVLFWHCARPQAGLLARPVDQNAIINDNTKASIAASRFSFDLAPSECTVVPQALVLVDDPQALQRLRRLSSCPQAWLRRELHEWEIPDRVQENNPDTILCTGKE